MQTKYVVYYRLDSKTLATSYLPYSFGTFDSFLTGQGRNHVYGACCSAQTDHKTVSTSSAKLLRDYSHNIYTLLVNFCFALVILTYLEKDPSKKVSQKGTKEVAKLEKQK